MKTMSVAKSDMALLSQEQLTQATFGALCQSFAMQILNRSGFEDGFYQRVALEFLEENQPESVQPVKNIFNIDFSLVLEAVRKEAQEQKREKKETEKLLERIVHIQHELEQQKTVQKLSRVEQAYVLSPRNATVSQQNIVIHNSFHHHADAVRQTARQAERTVLEQTDALRENNKDQEIKKRTSLTFHSRSPISRGIRDVMTGKTSAPEVQAVEVSQKHRPAVALELKQEQQGTQTRDTAMETAAREMAKSVEKNLDHLIRTESEKQASAEKKTHFPETRTGTVKDAGLLTLAKEKDSVKDPIRDERRTENAKEPAGTEQPDHEAATAQTAVRSHDDYINTQETGQSDGKPLPERNISHMADAEDRTAARISARQIRMTDEQATPLPLQPLEETAVFDPRGREALSFLTERDQDTKPGAEIREKKTETNSAVLSVSSEKETEIKSAAATESMTPEALRQIRLQQTKQQAEDRTKLLSEVRHSMAFLEQREIRTVSGASNEEANDQQKTGWNHMVGHNGEELSFRQEASAATQQSGQNADHEIHRLPQLPQSTQNHQSINRSERQSVAEKQEEQNRASASTAEKPAFPQKQTEKYTATAQAQEIVRDGGSAMDNRTEVSAHPDRREEKDGVRPQIPVNGIASVQPLKTVSGMEPVSALLTDRKEQIDLQQAMLYTGHLTEADMEFLTDAQRDALQQSEKRNGIQLQSVSGAKERSQAKQTETAEASVKRDIRVMDRYSQSQAALIEAAQRTEISHSAEKSEQQLSPEYIRLMQLYGGDLTDADLQFLTDSQRDALQKTGMRSGSRPETEPVKKEDPFSVSKQTENHGTAGNRDIRILDAYGKEASARQSQVMHTDALQGKATSHSAEKSEQQLSPDYIRLMQLYGNDLKEADLQFLSDEKKNVQQLKNVTMQQSDQKIGMQPQGAFASYESQHAAPNISDNYGGAGQRDIRVIGDQANKSEQLSPEYIRLMQLYADNLTEADLAFLTEGQRTQLLQESASSNTSHTVRNDGIQTSGPKDIRITGNAFERNADPADQKVALEQIDDLRRTEELSYRTEAEASETAVQKPRSKNGRDMRVLSDEMLPHTRPAEKQDARLHQNIAADLYWPTYAELVFPAEAQGLRQRGSIDPAVAERATAAELYHKEMTTESAEEQRSNPALRTKAMDIRTLGKLGRNRLSVTAEAQNKTEASDLTHRVNGAKILSAPQDHVEKNPMELTYASSMPERQNQPPADPMGQASASSYVESLPDWAQSYIKNGVPQTSGNQPHAIGGIARNIASLSGHTAEPEIMDWTAPNYSQLMQQASRKPAEVSFKEPSKQEQSKSHPRQLTDSELRRTADKVYQLIEDRIRRERRLLGL